MWKPGAGPVLNVAGSDLTSLARDLRQDRVLEVLPEFLWRHVSSIELELSIPLADRCSSSVQTACVVVSEFM
jgi:hypothetical protein